MEAKNKNFIGIGGKDMKKDIIDIVYEERLMNKDFEITEKLKKQLQEYRVKKDIQIEKLKDLIEGAVGNNEELKLKIKRAFDDYLEVVYDENDVYTENYYKIGFKDAMQLQCSCGNVFLHNVALMTCRNAKGKDKNESINSRG